MPDSPLPRKRQVLAVYGDGSLRRIEQDLPALERGMVLVEVHASLVSPGSELRGGWRALRTLQENPDTDAEPRPFGYSNTGVVIAVGEGVERFQKGDRVACIGGGYAQHADYAVVPQNLTVHLPAEVSFTDGSYAMLLATALHALRRGSPAFGERVAVAGLGMVGQLTARFHQLAGCAVIGWDTIDLRVAIARNWGIDAAVRVGDEDAVAATKRFTDGHGLDAAVLAVGGDADRPFHDLQKSMRITPDGHPTGTIVVVGGAFFGYTKALTNIDVRRASRTGPGYHDKAWERGATEYPEVFTRWTTRTNLELCMRLLEQQKIDVSALTTHTVPFDEVEEQTAAITREPDSILGMVFKVR